MIPRRGWMDDNEGITRRRTARIARNDSKTKARKRIKYVLSIGEEGAPECDRRDAAQSVRWV